jgi:hypothetical protein
MPREVNVCPRWESVGPDLETELDGKKGKECECR